MSGRGSEREDVEEKTQRKREGEERVGDMMRTTKGRGGGGRRGREEREEIPYPVVILHWLVELLVVSHQ